MTISKTVYYLLLINNDGTVLVKHMVLISTIHEIYHYLFQVFDLFAR